MRAGLGAMERGCWWRAATLLLASLCLAEARPGIAQTTPIAIVPVAGVELSGALTVADGKAMIGTSGSVTAGEHAATITLPHRGNMRICATTRVNLTADSSVDATQDSANGATTHEAPGLMMALGRGAIEANFATGHNSDVILTPDFRILISGPGTAQVRVRLGAKGDTCVDNRGPNAPYVMVTSIFDGGAYRVQQDQRVMFQHGSLREVVDNEKESCGCPAEPVKSATGNDFPIAQSAGLAPLSAPPPNAAQPGEQAAQITAKLAYDGTHPEAAAAAATPAPTPAAAVPSTVAPLATVPVDKPPKHSVMVRIGRFFKKLFGG